jgi:hypothetical protein
MNYDNTDGEPISSIMKNNNVNTANNLNNTNNLNNGSNLNSKKTDFMTVSGNIISNVNYKVAFMLFVLSIILYSDVFVDKIIRPIGDTVEDECPTSKGTIIQIIFLIMSYIIIDLVVKYDIL